MANKIVMGYWDCPFCDTKGIKGTLRACPNCGRARAKDTKFYMKAANHEEVVSRGEYLSEEEAATKGRGEDWQCSYCGSLNSVLDTTCKSCGHVRDESDKVYTDMRVDEDRKNAERAAAAARMAGTSSAQKQSAKQRFKMTKARAIILAIVAVVAVALVANALPHEHDYRVTGKDWERTVEVEQYLYVDESDWSLPDGGDLVETRSEIHHYNHVLDHYETRTRSYQERVETGSHTEYRYHDNGDGTFTEESYTVPDYSYETRYETYEEPVYRDDPVYATRYYYKIWRWRYKMTVTNAGDSDDEPADPTYNLAADERFGAHGATYRLHGYLDDDEEKTMSIEVDEARYRSVSLGDVLRVDTDLSGGFRSFADE